jgi:hypothetical protein
VLLFVSSVVGSVVGSGVGSVRGGCCLLPGFIGCVLAVVHLLFTRTTPCTDPHNPIIQCQQGNIRKGCKCSRK